ncbi:neural Wiskott-Aldrich syndrome protein-like [Chiroxiphia lanceolata]|uniref:neural Wiskott-Aldrich syndrome protein-like n=1 Tax=Chiroxiphia lanceolata TaxID=296741 RepID=UPI0013CF3A57|nr:neural Wiskott-Aldrich syndrome protein-like [Chiroxiphia lanceolata]
MTGRPALLLLLLLLAGTPRSARCCPGTLDPAPVSPGPAAPPPPPPPRGRPPPPPPPWARCSGPCNAPAAPPGPSSSPRARSHLSHPPVHSHPAIPPVPILSPPGLSGTVSPGRSGWGPQGGAQARLSPRSWDPPLAPFWTMATPQRFGRRR